MKTVSRAARRTSILVLALTMALPAISQAASVVPLASPVRGAIGSDFQRTRNRLVFVEFSAGYLSSTELIRSTAGIASADTATIQGTYTFDFDLGVQSPVGGADVWWEQVNSTTRYMVPRNTALITNVGVRTLTQFNAITPAQLQFLPYGTTPINGSNDSTNQLVNGDVFAVRTTNGNYTKVQVVTYGYNITVRWVTYILNPAYKVLGTGYTTPEDVKVTADGAYAYITERTGTLVRVSLSLAPNANRSAATVITSSLAAPHQIFLDEEHGAAYIVEFARPGRLVRVDLSSGVVTPVLNDLQYGIGLLLTSDRRTAYITEQVPTSGSAPGSTSVLSRVELSTGRREVLASSLHGPFFFLTWAGPGESSILTTERSPGNRIVSLNVATTPAVETTIANVPSNPSSVAVVASDALTVCCNSEVDLLGITARLYNPNAPLFMGIGHVPIDRIINSVPASVYDGYADTTGDAGYFFQVKDAPFGGVVSILVNHELARSLGAAYYRVEVDGNMQSAPWSDYQWNAAQGKFILTTVVPSATYYFPVRQAGDIWFNPWWGLRLDTTAFPDGIRHINIRLFSDTTSASEIAYPPGLIRFRRVRFDNKWPNAKLEQIRHVLPGGLKEDVDVCGIVTNPTNQFTFRITAYDGPVGHLLSWSLVGLYGNAQSSAVDSASYVPVPSRRWSGILSTEAPLAPQPPWTAPANCSYTFHLSVWDRTIDGYGYIHHSTDFKSIAIMSVP